MKKCGCDGGKQNRVSSERILTLNNLFRFNVFSKYKYIDSRGLILIDVSNALVWTQDTIDIIESFPHCSHQICIRLGL